MAWNALDLHRLARLLKGGSVPWVPQWLEWLTVPTRRSFISVEAELGPDVELGYGGMGVVIEAGVRIGARSFICQEVTLGSLTPGSGVPTLGEDVMVGSGAKILGSVRVGDRAAIGANAVVLEDVPPDAVVAGVPARILDSARTLQRKAESSESLGRYGDGDWGRLRDGEERAVESPLPSIFGGIHLVSG